MKQVTLIDFRGGYCSDVAPELMTTSELLAAQNCYWDSGLRKRQGTSGWDKVWGTATSIMGAIRSYSISASAFYNYLAVDNGASVTFYHQQASTTATLFAGFNFTTGNEVEFADLDGYVIAVNGVDKPAIFYCTATFEGMNLEVYDTREVGTTHWWAGQYDNLIYTDDTEDAQNATAVDFNLVETTASSGFFIACDRTFNKVYFNTITAISATGANYEYYTSYGTWSSLSKISSLTMALAATATQVMEFNWPSDWILADSYFATQTDASSLSNHYLIRVYFASCCVSTNCASIALAHTQYLTEVMGNDRPQAVAVHNRRVHLAAGNNVYISEYGYPTGWQLKYAEYFLEGGRKIHQMVPFQDYLVVLKENAIYGFYGNALDSWVKKRLAYGVGTISKRSAAAVRNDLFFVGRDAIYKWDGVNAYSVSKHIHSDFESWVATTAAGFNYKGEYWVSFPSSTITLRCDPDTFRTDEMGDGRVGWFKSPLGFRGFLYNQDGGDDGKFLGIVKCTATTLGGHHLCQLEVGHTGKDVWCGSTTAIDMVMQTGYRAQEAFGYQHRYTRVLPRISQVSSSVGATITHALMSNNSSVTVSITQVLNTGTGYDQEYYTIPYTLDGKNLSYYFRHNATQTVQVAGITFEAAGRYF